MNVYDIAIARALSSGGGGGGGDLYTAQVSVIGEGYAFYPMRFETNKTVGVADDEHAGLTDYFTDGEAFVFNENESFTWYILNNESIYLLALGANGYTVSGDAEVFSTQGATGVRIYGDCTITIS